MADFPSKVTTETSPPQPQQGGNSLRGLATNITTGMDISFIKSIPAILMIAEIFLGMIHWALIASTIYFEFPAYGWVMFVAITLWILTSVLFFMTLFVVHRQLPSIPWSLTVMIYHGVATLLYLTAFLTNAANVTPFRNLPFYGHLAAASFFGAVVTLAYGVSAFFSYMAWRGDGGNAATSTVPT